MLCACCAVLYACCAVRIYGRASPLRAAQHHAYAVIQYVSSDDVIKVPSVQKWAPPQFKHRAIFLNDEELLGVYLQLRTRQDRRRRWLLPVRVHTRALSGVQMILHSYTRILGSIGRLPHSLLNSASLDSASTPASMLAPPQFPR